MTDSELILNILADGEWHNVITIMKQGKPGAINWAVRSRVSDLKKKLRPEGYDIDSRIGENGQAEYMLIPAPQPDSLPRE